MANTKSSNTKRGTIDYLYCFEHERQKRVSLGTDSLRVAEEKRLQFHSARVRGADLQDAAPLPRRCYVASPQCTITKSTESEG